MALKDEIERLEKIAAAASRAATLLKTWRGMLKEDETPGTLQVDSADEDTAIDLEQSQVNKVRNAGIAKMRVARSEALLLPDL